MGVKEFDVQSVCLYKRYLMGNTIKWRAEKKAYRKKTYRKNACRKNALNFDKEPFFINYICFY